MLIVQFNVHGNGDSGKIMLAIRYKKLYNVRAIKIIQDVR